MNLINNVCKIASLSLLPIIVIAQDANYQSATDFAKSQLADGMTATKNLNATTSIPSYTSTPSQASSYGGVTQTSTDLTSKGATAFGSSDVGAQITTTVNNNPIKSLSTSSPFISSGVAAQQNSTSMISGQPQNCTQKIYTKSSYNYYTCNKTLDVKDYCYRNASIVVTEQPGDFYDEQTYTGNLSLSILARTLRNVNTNFSSVETGTIISATAYYPAMTFVGCTNFTVDYLFNGGYAKNEARSNSKYCSDTYYSARTIAFNNLNVPVSKGQSFSVGMNINSYYGSASYGGVNFAGPLVVTVKYKVTRPKYITSIKWTETCALDKSKYKLVSSQCTEPGGDKTYLYGGEVLHQSSDCWAYVDTYAISTASEGDCATYSNNPACTVTDNKGCSSYYGKQCATNTYRYQCQTTSDLSGMQCGGTFYCQSGDCANSADAVDSQFASGVSSLAALGAAGQSVTADQINLKAFTGKSMQCSKTSLGFSNCCQDSGWGQDVGLSSCNQEEKDLGVAKEKKLTVDLGSKCTSSFLGHCLKKAEVYCVFDSKLARIIQTQGRRDQLGVSFGSADSPDCSGIAIEKLQAIQFNLIDFSDFYEDLNNNSAIPSASTLETLIQQKVAAKMAGK